jgi:hypothetical protein
MLYLEPSTLSPDPTLASVTYVTPSGTTGIDLYPHELLAVWPEQSACRAWSQHLNLLTEPPPLPLQTNESRRVELLFDFGTEVDAVLEVTVNASKHFHLLAWFGESEVEAEGLLYGLNPPPMAMRFVDGSGRRTITFPQRGFRFVRAVFQDLPDDSELTRIVARAEFALGSRRGFFTCGDQRFQRVWESSIYTARLCTRANTIWDGIKRDRRGWYGDARIVAHAIDCVYLEPKPAEGLLLELPENSWANGIPGYSFDAIAMLRQHILAHGLQRSCVPPVFERIRQFLAWVEQTQLDGSGLITRTDQKYFQDFGFLDWSPYPVGGRFEELSWLQCQYAAGLRTAAEIAMWLGEEECATRWRGQYVTLAQRIKERFWNRNAGFIHTLNRVDDADPSTYPPNLSHLIFTKHIEGTWRDNIALGPSGASRQCNAVAVLAGLSTDDMKTVILQTVFDNALIPKIRTAYFTYYEALARGWCGDRPGAVMQMRDYIGTMLETEQSPTIWERYQPGLDDLRKYAASSLWSRGWVLSCCHGWGAGAVPLTMAFVIGIEPVASGYDAITLNPELRLKWQFSAEIPTRHGPILVERSSTDGPVHYRVPKRIRVANQIPEHVIMERT